MYKTINLKDKCGTCIHYDPSEKIVIGCKCTLKDKWFPRTNPCCKRYEKDPDKPMVVDNLNYKNSPEYTIKDYKKAVAKLCKLNAERYDGTSESEWERWAFSE